MNKCFKKPVILYSLASTTVTCRLLTQFPLPVIIQTSDVIVLENTAVVYDAIQGEWNSTAARRYR